ncbi:MAG: V-type ATP synthase subunit F [Eubacteriales bacterium]|nr:V-type ATP synthase subunit F [Eubacteriales bacterium]
MQGKLQKIGVIGQSDVVLAFRTLGMQVAATKTPQEAARAVHKFVTGGIHIIFITEDVARSIPETLSKFNDNPDVSLIPIPAASGTDGFGMQRLNANVERAIGANILLNNTEE